MTHVIGANGIDFLDFLAECHCLINDKPKEIVRGRFSRQKLKLSVDSAAPGRNNPNGNLRASRLRSCLWGHITHK